MERIGNTALAVSSSAVIPFTEEKADSGQWISKKQAGYLIEISRQAFEKRLKKGDIIIRETTGNGGKQYEVLLSSLLEAISPEKKVIALEKIKAGVLGEQITVRNAEIIKADAIFDKEEFDLALAKADLINFYIEAADSANRNEVLRVKESFLTAYNNGLAFQQLFNKIGEVTFKTIENWKRDYLSAGKKADALLRSYGKGATTLTKTEADLLLKELLSPNQPLHAEVVRKTKEVLLSLGYNGLKSDRTYLRFIENWKQNNMHVYRFARNGYKDYKDTVGMYISRDYSKIKAGDIIVMDGHDLNFTIMHPETKRPTRMTLITAYDMYSGVPLGFEIMPTENTAAIASAIRRTLLMLKFKPRIIYLDNGKAFRAKFFRGCNDFREAGISGLFERLGIEVIYAIVRNARAKTLERFHLSLAEFERSLPYYTGTSIANKPARLLQGEKHHTKAFDKYYGNVSLSIKESLMLMMKWFQTYINRPHGEGAVFAYRTPAQLFEDSLQEVRALEDFNSRLISRDDIESLMMNERPAKTYKGQIKLNGKDYTAEELHGLEKDVIVRYDILFDDEIIVIDKKTREKICIAEAKVKVHPAASYLGNAEDVRLLQEEMGKQKRLTKQTIDETKQLTGNVPYYSINTITEDFSRSEDLEIKKKREIAKKERAKKDDLKRQLEEYNKQYLNL